MVGGTDTECHVSRDGPGVDSGVSGNPMSLRSRCCHWGDDHIVRGGGYGSEHYLAVITGGGFVFVFLPPGNKWESIFSINRPSTTNLII